MFFIIYFLLHELPSSAIESEFIDEAVKMGALWKPPVIKAVMIVSLWRRVGDNAALIRCSGPCRCRNTQKIGKENSDSTVCIEPVSVDSQQSIFNLVCIAQAWLVLGAQVVRAGPVCVGAVNSSVLLSPKTSGFVIMGCLWPPAARW